MPTAPRKRLSSHFTIEEFDCHDGTRVPTVAVEPLRLLCNAMLEPMRERFGACTVVSGYRHASYNRAVGGAAGSYHLYRVNAAGHRHPSRPSGVAADLRFKHGDPVAWADFARRRRDVSGYMKAGNLGGVGLYIDAGFVHVDSGPQRDWRG